MNALRVADFGRYLFSVEPTAFHGEEPQLRFTFNMKPEASNSGTRLFAGHNIEFTVKNGLIELCTMRGDNEDKVLTLKVTSRSEDDRNIGFEDQLGFYRLNLKLEGDTGRYVVALNHPSNTYTLDPVFLQG